MTWDRGRELQRAAGAALALVFALGACSGSAAPDPARSGAAPLAAAAVPVPPVPAAPGPGKNRKVHVASDLFEFDYSWPAAADRIPALKRWLEADLKRAQAELTGLAREGRADAKANDFPFNPFASDTAWSRVADLPGWLSLSAATYEYSGGAHPNHGYAALLWDKAANRQRKMTDLFTSPEALSAAIREPFCTILDRERARRREAPVNRASGDQFDECIDPVQSTLILGSSNRQTFDRIGVLVGPYEAGPYAEGDYDVTLPVTPEVLAAVRPEYAAAFAPATPK